MIEVRNVLLNEVENIVKIHEESFKGFFLTTLGTYFLEKYYSVLLKSDRAILIGFFINGKMEGFCSVAEHSRGFNTKLIKANIISFTNMLMVILFTRPVSLVRLVKNLNKRNSAEDVGDYAEILSIAVSPNTQGKGAGRKMLLYLEGILKKKYIDKLSLTTDYFENDNAINFYKRLGYEVLYHFDTYPKRKMSRFIKKIN
jgi:ribosomal protein S18 acetylase RimI-like enzyme